MEPQHPIKEESRVDKDVNYINQGQKISNTQYARIKVFRRPLIAKMLIDSGNLVHDLVSEEFAILARIWYRPLQGKEGTVAKG